MLYIEDLSLVSKEKTLVQNISLRVECGQSVALMGHSGSGKSLTAMAAAGLLPHTIQQSSGNIICKGGVSVIMQNPADCFDPLFTLQRAFYENFAQEMPKKELMPFVHNLLHRVGFHTPENILQNYPFELSGGMLHRCMIALALGDILTGRSSCIIADEPLSGLDTPSRRHILQLLCQMQQEYHFALLYIDHDLNSAAHVTHMPHVSNTDTGHLAIMHQGRLVEQGPLQKVLAQPQHTATKKMVQAYERISIYMDDQTEDEFQTSHPEHAPLLRVHGVSKSYGPKQVLQDISLELFAGQSLGLVGANGAGKSTLIRLILGLENAHDGEIHCGAYRVEKSVHKALWRKDLQAVFQHARLAVNPRMQGRDILLEPLRAHKADFPLENKAKQDAKVQELLSLVELPASCAVKYPAHMSGGQLQRLCLARALALTPKILLLDESLADLDAVVAEQLQELLLRLKKQLGLAFLYISHDINSVLRLCDRVSVLHQGRIVDSFASVHCQSPTRHAAFTKLYSPAPKTPIYNCMHGA